MKNNKFFYMAVSLWLIVCALVAGALAFHQRNTLLSELEAASAILHREASQRADQHDVHLTALSTIAQSREGRRAGLFQEVAETIMRFYPRIDEIQLVPMRSTDAAIGTRMLESGLAEAIRMAAHSRMPEILAPAERPGHYMIVKRSPNTDDPRDGLALSIDVAGLLASEAPFWSRANVSRRLLMPDGRILFSSLQPFDGIWFSKRLGSATQPLLLETAISMDWMQILPPDRLIGALAMTTIFLFSGIVIVRQKRRARHAERRAELSSLEARLAHASRINTMGEMASGMAHELTQPLTAILSGAQAGKRLLAGRDTALLSGALNDVIEQARRASGILDRLRNWSRPQRQPAVSADLRISLHNVKALLAAEAARRGVDIVLRMPDAPVAAAVDPVEIEQVMFNLLRNAVESFIDDTGDRRVVASLRSSDEQAILEIADNGPGIAAEVQARIFTPFVTTRQNGMGLGLTLSQRLIERADGEIIHMALEPGTLFRITLPLVEITEGGKP